MNSKEILEQLKNALIEGEEDEAAEYARKGIEAGIAPMKLVKEGIQSAMDIVGKNFECGDAFLPELMLAGDAAKAALDEIVPHFSEEEAGQASTGTVVIGTMFGDNHDIGKNLVIAILSAFGFKVVDVGINAQPRTFIEAAEKEKADIIAASTLITTSLPYQREIVNILNDSKRRHQYFVIVGGGPVTPEWTAEIGADGYGRDAKDAAALCQQLMSGKLEPPLPKPVVVGALKRE